MTELGSRIQLSGAWTRLVVEALDGIGLDTDALCREAGVERDVLTDPTARFPRDVAGRLWRAAAKASGDRFIGLHAGASVRREPTHIFEFLFLKGSTVGHGFEVGLRFQGLVAHGEVVSLVDERWPKRLRLNRVEGDLPITPHEFEFIAATIHTYARLATRGRFRFERVEFGHPFRGGAEEYNRLFECPVTFGEAETELAVAEEIWHLPLSAGDPSAQDALVSLAEKLQDGIHLAGFLSSVSRAINRMLHEGHADIENVAADLKLSTRTLQRRLKEEGTTFRAVRDATRRSIVIEGIEQRRPAVEIARRAGIANERSLTRALRRWRREVG
ncbi:MAG: AraC family transcriptional regulator ligand-binding domain-containing protein [Myxococcota bacterium]